MTVGIFRYHILGLLFIALNRIIAPAFYAQKKPKLAAIAGLVNFGSNILLVLILSIPMKGQGIALALSLASMFNTIALFFFMKKMEAIEIGRLALGTFLYALKMFVFSIIAAIPTYFVHKLTVEYFADYSKIICYGAPILISGIVFAVVGVLELLITRDEIVNVIIRKVKK
jgi:putative peptidoglycan lipid II flippase